VNLASSDFLYKNMSWMNMDEKFPCMIPPNMNTKTPSLRKITMEAILTPWKLASLVQLWGRD
jgi:hypothetical protein